MFEGYASMHPNLPEYLEHIYCDYAHWLPSDSGGIRDRMILEFKNTLHVIPGNKYLKVCIYESVHSFIVNTHTDKQFKFGDILKAASWKTPARNFKRGSIETKEWRHVRWTGAM